VIRLRARLQSSLKLRLDKTARQESWKREELSRSAAAVAIFRYEEAHEVANGGIKICPKKLNIIDVDFWALRLWVLPAAAWA
jgi:hypothetical protein